jgi:hypothetical protein
MPELSVYLARAMDAISPKEIIQVDENYNKSLQTWKSKPN